MSDGLVIYGDSKSGNCYKIQLVCAELGVDYQWREVDILAGETRTPDFLAMNPIALPVPDRFGFQSCCIKTGIGFRDRKAGDIFTADNSGEPFLLLL